MKTLKCKNANKAVALMMNADGFGRILAIATEAGEYWFTVGWYKTEAGARRQAAKQMAALGYTLDI